MEYSADLVLLLIGNEMSVASNHFFGLVATCFTFEQGLTSEQIS